MFFVCFGTDCDYIMDCELFLSEIDWCLNNGDFCDEKEKVTNNIIF